MTYQEIKWMNKIIWVTGIMSNSRKLHRNLVKYVGRGGQVIGESKNGQLLVRFVHRVDGIKKIEDRCIPSGCVEEYGTVHIAKPHKH